MALIDSNIALAARDQLPETWDALAQATTFGEEALERRITVACYRLFGAVPDETEQADFSPLLVEYTGIYVALELIVPGIDFWSKQAISHSAGERESKAYKDRAEDLRKLAEDLLKKATSLLPDIEDELPQIPRRATDTARVLDSGFSLVHVTSDPMLFPPLYGPPPESTTG